MNGMPRNPNGGGSTMAEAICKDIQSAIKARKEAEIKYFGEFSPTKSRA